MKTSNRVVGGHVKTPKDENLADKQFWLEKIDSNPSYLVIAPREVVTQDMWEKTFQARALNASLLELVTPQMVTFSICKFAVQMNFRVIKHVPKEYLTYELFLEGIEWHFLDPDYSWQTDKDIENNLIAFISWAPDQYKIDLIKEWEQRRAEIKNLNMRGKPNDIDIPAKAQQTFPQQHKWWEFWK